MKTNQNPLRLSIVGKIDSNAVLTDQSKNCCSDLIEIVINLSYETNN